MLVPIPNLPLKILPPARVAKEVEATSRTILDKAAEYLQNRFDELIDADAIFCNHIKVMGERNLKAVVFGGWARDRIHELMNSVTHPSNDIDMVASGENSIVDILGQSATPTVFGGCGRMESKIYFDAWDLVNTFHIRRHSLDLKFETLPETADYTVNSLIFKPTQFFETPEIFEVGAFSAIQKKVIEFQSNEIILPIVQASRAVILAAKLDFELSATVVEFLQDMCKKRTILREVVDGVERYCPANFVDIAKRKLNKALYS